MNVKSRHSIKRCSAFKVIGLLCLLGLLLVTFVPAASALEGRQGEEVVIAADEVIADDLYVSAETFVLDGTVEGDLFVAAKTIIIDGVVTEDLWAAGQVVTLNGVVEDDVRLAGAVLELRREARIGDDTFALGNSLEAATGSEIDGSLFFGGAQAWLGGAVREDLFVGSYGLNLQGQVDGDVTANVGAPQQGLFVNPVQFVPDLPPVPKVAAGLTLGREAAIGGDLDYSAAEAIDIPAETVAGQVEFTPGVAFEAPINVSPGALAQRVFMGWLFDTLGRLVALVIVGVLLAWLVPAWITRPADALQTKPWPSLGWGALTALLFPLAVLLLIGVIVLLAILLGLVTFGKLGGSVAWFGLAFVLALLVAFGLLVTYFTNIVVGYWGGHLLLARFSPAWAENPIWPVLIGLVILVVLTAIPIIGWFLSVLITVFGLGTLWVLWRGERAAGVEPMPVPA